ncbi:MAG: thioredoxin reductase [Symbiobacteriaceae bacterium]|jgi:thioredoxin reductase (NADPH)|nr:thioredoxin reductase [Symbiobacteriaceae bacterium]
MRSTQSDLIIIGGGIAGLSTAIWARRVGLTALVLEQAAEAGGQLRSIAQPIIDFPGLEAQNGATLSDRVRDQALTAGAEFRPSTPVLAVDVAARSVLTPEGALQAGALVMATGLSPRRLGVSGEEELARRGLVHRPSRELGWFQGMHVAVVGGGDRAAENGLLLAKVAARVTLLHRGEQLRAREEFLSQLARAQERIALRLGTQVEAIEIADDDQVALSLRSGSAAAHMTVDAICIYIGNKPNSELVAGQAGLSPEGYIITDRHGLSSAPGLYAVGDVCTQPVYQSLSVAAGQAMVVAKHALLHRPE